MTFLTLLFAAGLPTSLGVLFMTYCLRKNDDTSILEKIFLGFGLGMGFVTFIMFLMGIFNIQFSLISITTTLVLMIIILSYLIYRSKMFYFKISFHLLYIESFKNLPTIQKIISIVLSLWIIFKVGGIIWETSLHPIYGWDAWMQWASGAKFFFYGNGFNLNPSDEHFFARDAGRVFLNYPLHVQLIQVWISLCMGYFSENFAKFGSVFYYIGLIGLLFTSVRKKASFTVAILFALFLASAPLLTMHAIDSYADLILAYYTFATFIFFLKLINQLSEKKAEKSTLIIMGCFSAMMVATKLEGVFYLISFSTVLITYLYLKEKKHIIQEILCYLLPILIINIPWYIFLAYYHIPFFQRGNDTHVTRVFHSEIFPVIGNELFFSANFNIIFFVFISTFILNIKYIFNSRLKYAYLALLGVLLLFMFLYLFTDTYKTVIYLTAIDRNILTFLPIVYLLTALNIVNLLKNQYSIGFSLLKK